MYDAELIETKKKVDAMLLQKDIKYLQGYEQGRADAIDELETELIDIIQGNENFIDWQKQEISLCLECAIETIKEQKNG